MNREELIEILRESVRLDVETTSEYVGDMDGSGSLYKDFHTLKLVIDGEVISQVSL